MDGIPRAKTKRMTIDLKSDKTLKIRYPHSRDDQRDWVKDNFKTLEF